jgi:hypothetical protein
MGRNRSLRLSHHCSHGRSNAGLCLQCSHGGISVRISFLASKYCSLPTRIRLTIQTPHLGSKALFEAWPPSNQSQVVRWRRRRRSRHPLP